MNALLDTHAFLWADGDPARLSPAAAAYLTDPACVVYLSVVSVWEMAIKVGLGKLVVRARQVPNDLGEIVKAIELYA